MQIVINIDDAIYKRAMVYKGEQFPDNDDLLGALITAVNNGTPLPKGHGRIVDIDKLDLHKLIDGAYFEPILEADRSEEKK